MFLKSFLLILMSFDMCQCQAVPSEVKPQTNPTHKAMSDSLIHDLDRFSTQAQPKALEEAKHAVLVRSSGAVGASGRAREIYGETYAALETKLLQLQLKGRQDRRIDRRQQMTTVFVLSSLLFL